MNHTTVLATKHDFSDIYNHPTCVKYYTEIMQKLTLVERNEIASKFVEKFIIPMFVEWANVLNKPLKFIDFFSCYGNDTLTFTNCFYASDFQAMWGSDDTCFTLPKPRQYPVETLAVDKSENALLYGKKAGIFDDTLTMDLNALSESQKVMLKDKCASSNILHINSLTYLTAESLFQDILDWFAQGKEPGMLIVGFVFPYAGVERVMKWKRDILSRFKFFTSLPSHNRVLDENESEKYGHEFGLWKRSYYEHWFVTRKVTSL